MLNFIPNIKKMFHCGAKVNKKIKRNFTTLMLNRKETSGILINM